VAEAANQRTAPGIPAQAAMEWSLKVSGLAECEEVPFSKHTCSDHNTNTTLLHHHRMGR
jgi:hypothetical protein